MVKEERSNLTNKYNPQERVVHGRLRYYRSNLTNKYNPQELVKDTANIALRSNLTNKYNPQERIMVSFNKCFVQILPINTILKN